jgi:hypothetical protein
MRSKNKQFPKRKASRLSKTHFSILNILILLNTENIPGSTQNQLTNLHETFHTGHLLLLTDKITNSVHEYSGYSEMEHACTFVHLQY